MYIIFICGLRKYKGCFTLISNAKDCKIVHKVWGYSVCLSGFNDSKQAEIVFNILVEYFSVKQKFQM